MKSLSALKKEINEVTRLLNVKLEVESLESELSRLKEVLSDSEQSPQVTSQSKTDDLGTNESSTSDDMLSFIFSRPDTSATLELMAHENVDVINKLITENSLSPEKISYYRTMRNNKAVYVLFYGIYNNIDIATNVAKNIVFRVSA